MKKLTVGILLFSITSHCLADVDVIVHPSNQTAIDAGFIKKVFTGKAKSFADGSKAIPLNQKEGELTTEFNEKALKKSSSQLKAFWAKQVFTGKATPPKVVASDAEMLSKVANNPNLIGFVRKGTADSTVRVVQSY